MIARSLLSSPVGRVGAPSPRLGKALGRGWRIGVPRLAVLSVAVFAFQWSPLSLRGHQTPASQDEETEQSAAPVLHSDTFRAEFESYQCTQLAELAQWCDQCGLTSEAAITRAWHVQRHPGRNYFFLPDEAELPTLAPNATEQVSQWHERLLQIRQHSAESLYDHALDCLSLGRHSEAYALLHESLRENPDHQQARQVLGYRNQAGRWVGPQESIQVRRMRVAHPHFGWRASSYWRIETEHFDILTNSSEAEARSLARQLEAFATVWSQLFFDYCDCSAELEQQVRSPRPRQSRRERFRVVLFANRNEYTNYLIRFEPLIEITKGLYRDSDRTTYLYLGDDESLGGIWYHEAAHQLFQQQHNYRVSPAGRANFWVLEGVAMYMESIAWHSGYATVGGFDADRLQFARYRMNNARWQVPLANLVQVGREDFQSSQEIRWLYSQSAGLSHFFMDGEQGRYRPALLNYLKAVYSGRHVASTLATLTETGYGELDERYQQFLAVDDHDLEHLLSASHVRRLSLGLTDVSDQGMAHLTNYERLTWLDLSACRVSDAGVAHLSGCTSLEQLGLQATRVGDPSMAVIGQLTALDELDLSGTAITDAGLQHLGSLQQLRMLWLADTAITDAGVAHLRGLERLEQLDLSGTSVTRQGIEQLRRSLPQLREVTAAAN